MGLKGKWLGTVQQRTDGYDPSNPRSCAAKYCCSLAAYPLATARGSVFVLCVVSCGFFLIRLIRVNLRQITPAHLPPTPLLMIPASTT
jgi:hypothetical protein